MSAPSTNGATPSDAATAARQRPPTRLSGNLQIAQEAAVLQGLLAQLRRPAASEGTEGRAFAILVSSAVKAMRSDGDDGSVFSSSLHLLARTLFKEVMGVYAGIEEWVRAALLVQKGQIEASSDDLETALRRFLSQQPGELLPPADRDPWTSRLMRAYKKYCVAEDKARRDAARRKAEKTAERKSQGGERAAGSDHEEEEDADVEEQSASPVRQPSKESRKRPAAGAASAGAPKRPRKPAAPGKTPSAKKSKKASSGRRHSSDTAARTERAAASDGEDSAKDGAAGDIVADVDMDMPF